MIKRLGPEIKPIPGLLYALPNGPGDLGYANVTGFGPGGQDSVIASATPAVPGDPVPDQSFAGRIVERALGGTAELRPGKWTIPGKVSVPLRRDGSLLIDYAPGSGLARSPAFRRVSLLY